MLRDLQYVRALPGERTIMQWSIRFALGLLLTLWAGNTALLAQEPTDDAEGRFYFLLDNGYALDDAMELVAGDYGRAVAVDVAVYLCSPMPDDNCEGSEVWDAWDTFLEGIDHESVSEVVQGMSDYDPYLVNGIAVYWCSPDPGDGCGDDPFTQAWDDFYSMTEDDRNPAHAIDMISATAGPMVAQLIAASACGEATCYAEAFAELDADELAQIAPPTRSTQAKQQAGSGLQFADKPPEPPTSIRQALCKAGKLKTGC